MPTDDAFDKKLVKDVDSLHTFVKKNLQKFDQKPLRAAIRKLWDIHGMLDMQRDVRNEQGRSGATSATRKKGKKKR